MSVVDMFKPILVAFIPRLFSMVVANINPDHTTLCNGLTCETKEQCIIRKFWCDYTECPRMIYCSKSQLESLRGPESCASVLCPNGYKCVLRFRECLWNYGCQQRLARCISDVELADEPATCANVKCGRRHHCILRETHYCPRPPCRLTKSCAYSEDVEIWFDKCRRLGCRSEYECFLRKPPDNCARSSCAHIPDCLVTPDPFESTSNKLCHGWICPADQVCSARLQDSCSSPSADCPILRSCSRPVHDLTQRADVRTTLSDIERDIFLEEQRRLQQYFKPLNFTQAEIRQYYDGVLPIAGQLWKNLDDATPSPMKPGSVSVRPIMRSTSQQGDDSAWLTYLKRRAGAQAVRYWIDKAKSNQDYEGFVEWLDTIKQLLDPDTYRLWLMEIESASDNVPEFQAWISPRNLAAHRLAAAASSTQRTLPVPIANRAKNVFHGDMPQDFEEAVKNSWKSWQSYYQWKPPGLSEFAGQMADSPYWDTKAHQNVSIPQMFFMDDRYASAIERNADVAARYLEEQIEGFKEIQPDVAKLDPYQTTSQLTLSSTPMDNEQLPNLLIYFPPPLNFFIYYFVGSRNRTGNITLQTNDKSDSKTKEATGRLNSGSYIPDDYDDNPDFYNKPSPMDKQKEFEFIRKIIRELINYWDDEEQSFSKSDKFDGIDGVRADHFNDKPRAGIVTDKVQSNGAEGNPTFIKFLEWLYTNGHINSTQLSDLSSRMKDPLTSEKSVNPPNPLTSENNKFRKDSRQVAFNLSDYLEPQEESLERLINIASKKLHRNITGEEKMPKMFWVFPVFGNEENETIANEIDKRSKEKVNPLEDMDAAATHTNNDDGSHYVQNNPNINSGSENVAQAKNWNNNEPNVDNSNKDTEGEYYDDQDMYDEDDYEQSELNESMEN